MEKRTEFSGKTVEEAILKAVMNFGISRDNLNIEIIEEENKGFLGIGGKSAVICVVQEVEDEPEEIVEEEIKEEPEEEVVEVATIEKPIIRQAVSEKQTKAVNFLLELLTKMDIKADLLVDEVPEENTIYIEMVGDKMGLLIGHRGETLDAIQYLVSLILNKGSEEYTRIVLDTEDYRQKRVEILRNLAIRLAKKVEKTRRRVVLEPMNPYERKIIHSALQDFRSVKTHSEGVEPYRKVVITNK